MTPERKLQLQRSKIGTKDQEIKRLLNTLNYKKEVKETIFLSLKENPLDVNLRDEILKVFKSKISEENATQGKRKFGK